MGFVVEHFIILLLCLLALPQALVLVTLAVYLGADLDVSDS